MRTPIILASLLAAAPAAAQEASTAILAARLAPQLGITPPGFAHEPNPTLLQFGDSRLSIAMLHQTIPPAGGFPFDQLNSTSVVAWARRLGARITVDPTKGYPGQAGGILKTSLTPNNPTAPLAPGNGSGTGYTAASMCSAPGGATFGAPTVDRAGGILTIPVLTPGTAYTAAPTITCSGGAGLQAIGVVGGTGTFADVGENTCQAYQRIPDVEAVAVPGDQILVRLGTNDETAGLSLTQSLACTKQILDRLLGDGYYVIWQLDSTRSVWNGISGTTPPAPQYRSQLYARRKWVRQYAAGDRSKNTAGYPHLLVFDAAAEVTDTTSPTGDPKPGYLPDGLHDGQRAAYIGGWKLAQIEAMLLPTAPDVFGNPSQADTFDATYNPQGAFNANPGLTGNTGGAPASTGGLTFTGTIPASYNLSTSGNTGTQTIVAGPEPTPRTDGLNGARTQFVIACSGGSAGQTYTLAMPGSLNLAAAGFTSATNGTSGAPRFRLDVDAEFSGQTNLMTNGAYVFSQDSGGPFQASTIDGSNSNYSSPALANAGVYDGPVPPLSSAIQLHYQSPALQLSNIGTGPGTEVSLFGLFTWGLDCSQTSGVTVKIGRFSLHQVL